MSRQIGSGQGDEYNDILNSKMNKRKASGDILIGHTADEFHLKDGEEQTFTLKDSSVLSEGEDVLEHSETAKRRDYEKAKSKDAKFKRRRVDTDGSLLDKYDSDEEAPRVLQSNFEETMQEQADKRNNVETLAQGIERVEKEGVKLSESTATLVTDDFYTEEVWEQKSKKSVKKKKKVEWDDDDDEDVGMLKMGSASMLGMHGGSMAETKKREFRKVDGVVTGNIQSVLSKQQEALKATVYLDTIRKANEKNKHILGDDVGLDSFVPVTGKDRLAMLRGNKSSNVPVTLSQQNELVGKDKKEGANAPHENHDLQDVLQIDEEEEELAMKDAMLQKGKVQVRVGTGLGEEETSLESHTDYINSLESEITARMQDDDHVASAIVSEHIDLDHRVSGNPLVMSQMMLIAKNRGYFSKSFVNRFEGRSTDKVISDAIVYTDDKGKELTTKEAFRQLSYKFHGYTTFKEKAKPVKETSTKDLKKAQQLLDRLQNKTTYLKKEDNGQVMPVPMGRKELLEYKEKKEARLAELEEQRRQKEKK